LRYTLRYTLRLSLERAHVNAYAGAYADADVVAGVNLYRLYHAQGLRLGTFSKKHANIFTGSNRAKSDDDNGIKRITITLVESV